jgi:hypothetical protein
VAATAPPPPARISISPSQVKGVERAINAHHMLGGSALLLLLLLLHSSSGCCANGDAASTASGFGPPARTITMNSSASWTFIGGVWSAQPDRLDPLACRTGDRANCVAPGAAEVIVPSVQTADHNMAFLTSEAFVLSKASPTLLLEFDWRAELYWTAPGLVWGTDSTHFHEVSFPVAGQQYRAEHSWLLVAQVNTSSGWREARKYTMLNGLSSAITVWHHTAVAISAESITVTVDGVVTSSAFIATGFERAFHIGLSTYDSYGHAPWPGGAWPATSRFRNFTVSGYQNVAPEWSDAQRPRSPWRPITAATDPTGTASQIMRTKSGKLLLANGKDTLLQSTDAVGSDWVATNRSTAAPSGSVLRLRDDGQLESYDMVAGKDRRQCQLVQKVGADAGRGTVLWAHSFSWPIDRQTISFFLRLDNGSLLVAFTILTNSSSTVTGGPNVTMNVSTPQNGTVMGHVLTFPTGRLYRTGRPPYSLAFSIISNDLGVSWGSLQPLDGAPFPSLSDNAPFTPATPYIPKYKWMSEMYATQLQDGSILAFVRPETSPFLWQAFAPSGKAFGPMARGMKPMYACAMTTTASGVVLIGGRHPGLAVLASWNNGMSWSTYSIDTVSWAQGAMIEVAKDVVLFIYGGRYAQGQLRSQYLRVFHNPNRLESISAAEAQATVPLVHTSYISTVSRTSEHRNVDTLGGHRPSQYAYSGGKWLHTPSGGMTGPDNAASMNLAIATKSAFAVLGLEASFQFKWRNSYTTAGFVFGCNCNGTEFYVLDFPFSGGGPFDQKTEMVWVTLSRVRTAAGWRETILSQLMTGVSSDPEILHSVSVKIVPHVTRRGVVVRVEVDERGLAELHVPETNVLTGAGFVGLATHNNLGVGNKCLFINLAVYSSPVSDLLWKGHAIGNRVPFHVINAPSPSGVGNIVRMANGDLLMTNAVPAQRTNKTLEPGTYLLRSTSGGQTWVAQDPPLSKVFTSHCKACSADDHGFNLLVSEGGKTVLAFAVTDLKRISNGSTVCTVSRASSNDFGVHWSAPVVAWQVVFGRPMPFLSVTLNSVVALRGKYLGKDRQAVYMFLTGATNVSYSVENFGQGRKTFREPTSVLPLSRNFVVHSSDGGMHFGTPLAWLDGGPFTWATQLYKDGDQGQVSAVQLKGGDLLALIRPDFQGSPWVWESRARVGGDIRLPSFGPMARGRFHMKATVHATVTTASGVTLIGGRFPQMSVQASWDNGITWQLTSIDAAFMGYGAMVEVEPDVVLFVYGGLLCCPTYGTAVGCPRQTAPQCARQLRFQMLRVEHDPPRLRPA